MSNVGNFFDEKGFAITGHMFYYFINGLTPPAVREHSTSHPRSDSFEILLAEQSCNCERAQTSLFTRWQSNQRFHSKLGSSILSRSPEDITAFWRESTQKQTRWSYCCCGVPFIGSRRKNIKNFSRATIGDIS